LIKSVFIFIFLGIPVFTSGQENSLKKFLADSSMIHANASIFVIDMDNMETVLEYNSVKSLTPASVMKLITSATALQILGPDYTFKTVIGYSGKLNTKTGKLTGDIIIKGGGDPALGSEYFKDHYGDFLSNWVTEIKKAGIKKIKGRIITDDSYFDDNPIPAKWLIEDIGNYYGAGVYGLSVFDNTYEIHFNTTDTNNLKITKILPEEFKIEIENNLKAKGSSDEGYIFSEPYGSTARLEGTIPVNDNDFVLKGSISDPPLLIAKILSKRLETEGIKISENPSTFRLENIKPEDNVSKLTETSSPNLSEIIKVLNHESVNLYAETLISELGRKNNDVGSESDGLTLVEDFLENAGIRTDGMFIEDGSGLSPANSINSRELVNLLVYMNQKGSDFTDFFHSLPEAGKNGTLKTVFRDEVFNSRLRAKSGSMTRVRCYAGYLTTLSGKHMAFSILVNNFSGPSKYIIAGIEDILKEIINNR
jgi:D-alanyl-D-alanine carboxypeptidase/D-alanyl-D-alanine-endopeptidase (penicillin-binding protein 4)